MTTPPNLPMTLIPATTLDIPQLARIHVIALESDGAAALKFSTESEFQSRIENMLKGQIPPDPSSSLAPQRSPSESPTPQINTEAEGDAEKDWYVIKAVLPPDRAGDEAGGIVGWASWHVHRGGGADSRQNLPSETPPKQSQRAHDRGRQQAHDDKSEDDETAKETNDTTTFRFDPGIGQHVSAHSRRVFEKWNERRRAGASASSISPNYLSLRALFVLPVFRRHGIGSALVAYGTSLSDKIGLSTVVQASSMGKPIYERAGGFTVFDSLNVNLSEWEEGVVDSLYIKNGLKGKVNRVYWFWYLERHPQSQ